MKNVTGKLTALALTALLAACGNDKNLGKEIGQNVDEPELMRTWEGDCHGSDILDLSLKSYFAFDGDDYKEVHTFYAESDCKGDAAEISYTGAITLKEKAPNGERAVDFRFDKVEAMAVGPRGKEVLEKAKLCGIETWDLGKAIELNGKTGTMGCPLRKVPAAEYNLATVENKILFLGKFGLRGGASVEKDRPTKVDRDTPFCPSDRKIQ